MPVAVDTRSRVCCSSRPRRRSNSAPMRATSPSAGPSSSLLCSPPAWSRCASGSCGCAAAPWSASTGCARPCSRSEQPEGARTVGEPGTGSLAGLGHRCACEGPRRQRHGDRRPVGESAANVAVPRRTGPLPRAHRADQLTLPRPRGVEGTGGRSTADPVPAGDPAAPHASQRRATARPTRSGRVAATGRGDGEAHIVKVESGHSGPRRAAVARACRAVSVRRRRPTVHWCSPAG